VLLRVIKRKDTMMKRTLLSLCILSAFLLAGCNDFLSAPPGSVAVNLEAAPTAVPGNVDCAISWKTNVETKHILEYGTATGVYTVATPLSAAESKDHSVSLASLLPATTYYYRVRSYYRTSQEENSEEYSFTTVALTAIAITEGPTLTVGQTSCDLSWTTNVPTKHAIEYGTSSGAYSASTVLSGTASATHSASITGLSPSTTYYYRVRSTYQNGLEGLSAESSFTTLAGPASLSFSSAPVATPALTSASIAYATNYPTISSIEYGTASGVYTESIVLDSSAPTHTRGLSGLAQGTTYYYVVHCYSASNGSIVSPQYSFTTTAEASPTLAQRLRGIWLVGGCSGFNWTTPVSQIDMFDPVTSTWYPGVATLFTPVSFAAVGIVINTDGHQILVIAGGFDLAGTVRNNVQLYDINSSTWITTGLPGGAPAVLPSARANVVGAVRNNLLYVIGGTTQNANVAYAGSTTDYAYDISTNTWGTKVVVATGADKATAVFNDSILFVGGRTTAYNAVATAHDGIFVSLNVLSTATEVALPAARTGHSSVTYTTSSDSSVLVVLAGLATANMNTCFILNPVGATGTPLTTNTVQYLRYPFIAPSTWQNGTNLPSNIALGSAVVYNNKLYYFGGTDPLSVPSGRSTAYTMQFSDTGAPTNSWNTISTMPVGRYGHAAVRFE
jgi:hypothetical protein